MKLLGVDFGTKRIGLALSDPQGRLAFPHKTLYKTTRDKLFAELVRIVEEERVEAVIVGLPIAPLAADGAEPLVMRQVRNFAESLGRRLRAPIYLIDERCSSLTAEEQLREAGLRGEELKAKLDQQAAVLILQTYIQSHPELC